LHKSFETLKPGARAAGWRRPWASFCWRCGLHNYEPFLFLELFQAFLIEAFSPFSSVQKMGGVPWFILSF
jgi:hypothetical protein